MSHRKHPRNFGTQLSNEKLPPDSPDPTFAVAAGRFSVTMPERVLLILLRQEMERLSKAENVDDLTLFFRHFYTLISEEELQTYVSDFQRKPPTIKLGYPRSSAQFPHLAIILEGETQTDEALADFLGQTLPGDPDEYAKEYVGSMFEQTYGIYIYAEHPDVCLYLYHFAKAIIMSADITLQECGILEPAYSGNEMIPQQDELPENMFVRRLGITCKSLHTVPAFLLPDPGKVRITGVWAEDIVVSGVRGGVHAIDPPEAISDGEEES